MLRTRTRTRTAVSIALSSCLVVLSISETLSIAEGRTSLRRVQQPLLDPKFIRVVTEVIATQCVRWIRASAVCLHKLLAVDRNRVRVIIRIPIVFVRTLCQSFQLTRLGVPVHLPDTRPVAPVLARQARFIVLLVNIPRRRIETSTCTRRLPNVISNRTLDTFVDALQPVQLRGRRRRSKLRRK